MHQDQFDFSRSQPVYPKAPAYSNDTTSKAAAQSLKPSLGRLQQRIYDAILAQPRTARQIETDLEMRPQTVTARIRELVLLGRVVDSGEKRETGSGRKAIVWAVKA